MWEVKKLIEVNISMSSRPDACVMMFAWDYLNKWNSSDSFADGKSRKAITIWPYLDNVSWWWHRNAADDSLLWENSTDIFTARQRSWECYVVSRVCQSVSQSFCPQGPALPLYRIQALTAPPPTGPKPQPLDMFKFSTWTLLYRSTTQNPTKTRANGQRMTSHCPNLG